MSDFDILLMTGPIAGFLLNKSFHCYPLPAAGLGYAPMMFEDPGDEPVVRGELCEVTASELADVGKLQAVGLPGNFRKLIEVE
jgi:gamma-glutamylaminecyclotransferase